MRQQFVPSANGVSSIGVCVSTASPGGASLSVVVRAGTLAAPGPAAGGGAVVVPSGAPDVGFVHVDFAAPLNVAPGEPHVIEISANVDVTWLGTSPGVDLYAPGAASSGAVEDFAFRSYLAPGYVPPTPTKTKTPKPTATRTPASTPTPLSVLPTLTPPPGATVPPIPPTPPLPAPTTPLTAPPTASGPPPATSVSSAVATAFTGATLPQYTGRIYPPDVGGRPGRGDSPVLPASLLAMVVVGSLIAALGVAVSASGRRSRPIR
jgi:hypothetical protein